MIIVKNNNLVIGLTTAAGMWATASISIALGYGFYRGASIATIACVFTAAFLTRLERKRNRASHIYLEIDLIFILREIIAKIHNTIDPEALIETVSPKSNVQNSIGLYFTVSNLITANKLQLIDEIEGVCFSIVE